MAPIKFEENIKDKLEHRTLSPSTDSWSKLSKRLDDADDNRSKKTIFWWLGIAAGLLIMIALTAQFHGTSPSETVLPEIVEDDKIIEPLKNIQIEPFQKESIELANEDHREQEDNEVGSTHKTSKNVETQKSIYKKTEPDNQLALQSTPVEENRMNTSQEAILNNEVQDLLEEARLKIAVAEAVQKIKLESTTVSDKEIDSLLKIASKELFKDNLKNELIQTVDANALLMSVEDEMGQSFRSRVFEALKDSYETVKTAVADRNH